VGSKLRGGLQRFPLRRSRRTASTVQLPEEVDMRATQIHEAANMDRAANMDKIDEALSEELRHQQEDQEQQGSASASVAPAPATPAAPLTLHDCRIRYVVIDCTSIVDIDDTALKMLMALAGQLQVQVAFCMLNTRMRDLLGRVHLFHAAALAAMEMQAHDHPQGPAGAAHSISMSDLSAIGVEEEIGLARPWASVHQAVKYVVEHMRLQSLKAHAAQTPRQQMRAIKPQQAESQAEASAASAPAAASPAASSSPPAPSQGAVSPQAAVLSPEPGLSPASSPTVAR